MANYTDVRYSTINAVGRDQVNIVFGKYLKA